MKNIKNILFNRTKKKNRRRLNSIKKRKILRRNSANHLKILRRDNYDYKFNAPINFDFQRNFEFVIGFISKIENALHKEKTVFINMTYVQKIDFDTIILLLGIMAEFKAKNINFNGNFPKNKAAKTELLNSGFLDQLYPNQQSYKFGSKNGIYTHGKKIIDQEFTANLISSSITHIFGPNKRSQGAQRILIEAMKNTLEHANPFIKSSSWWLSIKQDYIGKRTIFSFLDYGIGIFRSLKTKDKNSPGYTYFEQFFELGINNEDVLKKIMNNELHNITRTKLANHGTGLPSMKTAFDNNFISKLVILTNDVYADISANTYKSTSNNFSGTLIQFEINSNNKTFSNDVN